MRSFIGRSPKFFAALRDLHTVYVLPSGYQGRAAFLPFLVEEYFETPRGEPRYLVSHWIDPFTHTSFKKGSEVLFWNGVPIRRAVELNEEWVTVSYRATNGTRLVHVPDVGQASVLDVRGFSRRKLVAARKVVLR